ncbi:Bacterial Ig-like domain (group 2) [compost metagenome]
MAVTAEYDTGKTAVVTGAVVWTSSKPSVVSISQNGTITALAKGTASVKGKFGTKTITVTVTVK